MVRGRRKRWKQAAATVGGKTQVTLEVVKDPRDKDALSDSIIVLLQGDTPP